MCSVSESQNPRGVVPTDRLYQQAAGTELLGVLKEKTSGKVNELL